MKLLFQNWFEDFFKRQRHKVSGQILSEYRFDPLLINLKVIPADACGFCPLTLVWINQC